MRKPLAIVITGPTASGKSALAVKLALALNTDIVSADSRQIYKGIPVATAVPSEDERCGVRHHLLETLDLADYYSASRFVEDASDILDNIFLHHDVAIVCGGSMMYTDALCYGIDDLPTVPDYIRLPLMAEWKEKGDEWLLGRLLELDSVHYWKVDRKNMKRVFHAVEITLTAGIPYSSLLSGGNPGSGRQQSPLKEKGIDFMKITLEGSRDLLFSRINARVLQMMEAGLEEEARKVEPLKHLNSLNTVGLKEMFAYFEGAMTREEAISRIQKNTRVYAKKQVTWHKRDKNAARLDFATPPDKNVSAILNMINQSRP